MNQNLQACFAIMAQAMMQCALLPPAEAASVQPVFTNDTVANTLSFNDTFGHTVAIGTYSPSTGLWTSTGVAGGFTNLTVSGNATVGGTLGVTGLTTLGSLTVNGTLTGSGVSSYFASPPPIGSTAANTGAFTTLSATGALSGAGFNSLITAPPLGIGSVTPNGGAFTTLSASSTVSGAGFANYLLSPPAIGNTAANTGAFTTLSATGNTLYSGAINRFNLSAASGLLVVYNNAVAAAGLHPAIEVDASKNVTTANGGTQGIYSVITDLVGGSGSFVEGERVGGVLASGTAGGAAFGIVAAVNETDNTTTHVELVGGEFEIDSFSTAAPLPSAMNINRLSISVLGDAGKLPSATTVDAFFMTNPFAGYAKGQAGFEAAGPSIAYAAFVDTSTTGVWGMDLAFATHTTGAIRLKNSDPIAFDNVAHSTTFNAINFDTLNELLLGTGSPIIYMQATNTVINGALALTQLAANASVATVLGSVGPTGSHTTVQEWFKVLGTGSAIRYVPGF